MSRKMAKKLLTKAAYLEGNGWMRCQGGGLFALNSFKLEFLLL